MKNGLIRMQVLRLDLSFKGQKVYTRTPCELSRLGWAMVKMSQPMTANKRQNSPVCSLVILVAREFDSQCDWPILTGEFVDKDHPITLWANDIADRTLPKFKRGTSFEMNRELDRDLWPSAIKRVPDALIWGLEVSLANVSLCYAAPFYIIINAGSSAMALPR